MTRQIVLFGGSFDPVHNGHLIVARWLAERCGFQQITLVPAARSPHKPGTYAPAEHRLAMLRLAIQGEGLFDLCDLELHRRGPSYTFDTLTALRERTPGASLHWIIGADMLEDLPAWHRVHDVLAMTELVIVTREPSRGGGADVLASLRGKVTPQEIDQLRRGMVATPRIDISSTMIRARVREGRSIRYLVPEAVAEYIRQSGLYRQE